MNSTIESRGFSEAQPCNEPLLSDSGEDQWMSLGGGVGTVGSRWWWWWVGRSVRRRSWLGKSALTHLDAVGGEGTCSRSTAVEKGQCQTPKGGCRAEREPKEEIRRTGPRRRQTKGQI